MTELKKKPAHPTHPSRGTWKSFDNFELSDKGMDNPNYSLFGLNDNKQDPQAVLTYNNSVVLPEITVSPAGNYVHNPYDNINIYAYGGKKNRNANTLLGTKRMVLPANNKVLLGKTPVSPVNYDFQALLEPTISAAQSASINSTLSPYETPAEYVNPGPVKLPSIDVNPAVQTPAEEVYKPTVEDTAANIYGLLNMYNDTRSNTESYLPTHYSVNKFGGGGKTKPLPLKQNQQKSISDYFNPQFMINSEYTPYHLDPVTVTAPARLGSELRPIPLDPVTVTRSENTPRNPSSSEAAGIANGVKYLRDYANSRGISDKDLVMAGLNFVPVVGTLIDAYNFVKDPSLENAGYTLISAASDVAGPFKGFVRAGARPIFRSLLKTMSKGKARRVINTAIGAGKGSTVVSPIADSYSIAKDFINKAN